MKKSIFIISMLINLLFLFVCGVYVHKQGMGWVETRINGVFDKSKQTYNPTTDRNYLNRENELDSFSNQGKIIMLGDSITANGEWNELLNNNVLNRGISGDTTSGVLARLNSQVIKNKPSKIFIMIGINDLIQNKTPQSIVENYKKIIESLTSSLPNTKIYIQSTLYTNNDIYSDNKINFKDVQYIDDNIKSLSNNKSIYYIDLTSLLTKDNKLEKQYTFDGLHVNGQGYLVWKNAIEKYVNEQ